MNPALPSRTRVRAYFSALVSRKRANTPALAWRARANKPALATALALPVLLLVASCVDPIAPEAGGVDDPYFDHSGAMSVAPQVDAYAHMCALRSDGGIECWGNDNFGQAPSERLAAVGHYVQVAVDGDHGCALRDDGVVECWGTYFGSAMPDTVAAHAGGFVRIAVGDAFGCGVRDDGVIECWSGADDMGQAPDSVVAPASSFIDVTAGDEHACGLRADGTVNCWVGALNVGQAPASREASVGDFEQIDAAVTQTCGVRSDGVVECWGVGGDTETASSEPGTHFAQVAVGLGFRCALRNDGSIECWGDNSSGQATPPTEGSYTQISAGNTNACAMRSDEVAVCWGTPATTPPNAPGDVAASWQSETGAVLLSWADNSVERRFVVERRVLTDTTWGPYEVLVSPPGGAVGVIDTSAAEGLRYGYRVQACGIRGCSAYDTAEVATADLPGAPVEVLSSSNLTGDSMTVSWTPADENATYFELWRRVLSDSGSLWKPHAVLSDTSYVDSTLMGARYRYRVRACNVAGCSAFTQGAALDAGLAPPAPALAPLFASGPAAITLLWTGPGATSFEIERRSYEDGAYTPWSALVTLPGTSPAGHTDTTATIGTRHQYRVRGCNVRGCGPYTRSNALTAQAVGPVAGLLIGGAALLYVEGPMPEGANRVVVQRQTWDDGAADWLGWKQLPIDTLPFHDTDVAPATTYRYRVRGCSDLGCGAWFVSGGVTTEAFGPPAAAQDVNATTSASGIDLHWFATEWIVRDFMIQRRENAGGGWSDWTTISTAPQVEGANVRHDDAVSAGTSYRYRMRSCTRGGCSAWSSSAAITPTGVPGPTDLRVDSLASSIVIISWSHPGTPSDGFQVYRRSWDENFGWGSWGLHALPDGNTKTYTDIFVSPGDVYEYRVRACETECSSWLVTDELHIPVPAPSFGVVQAIVEFDSTGISYMAGRTTWNDPGGMDHFEIERRTWLEGSWGSWSSVGQTAGNVVQFDDTTVETEHSYQYRVRACATPSACSEWLEIEGEASFFLG